MTPQQALKQYFGYDTFRPRQQEIISHILAGHDTLVIMPTGGGKSLCYQLPAVLLEGITIVISPLIALMKDQVDGLNAIGINSCYINSSLDEATRRHQREQIKQGQVKIVYLAPESLHVLESLKAIQTISLIAVDEAHCISSWGHDFRPAYQQLGVLKERLPGVPLVGLTATADEATRRDIMSQLSIQDAHVFLSSFDRPNLSIEVRPAQKRNEQIIAHAKLNRGEPGIVYCMGRKTTESVAKKLQASGLRAAAYHAGLDAKTRDRVQEDFLMDRTQIICATIAFGMGIDKSNIRRVIHYNLPKSIESFYQEIGRAGRDGLDSKTILFYSYRDVSVLTQFANQSGNAQVQLAKLERMKHYAESLTCRRKILMNYFGELTVSSCGNCDICDHPPEFIDGTVIAQKALSTIVRVGEREAMSMIIHILRGSQSLGVVTRGYTTLKTYGIGKEISSPDWQRYIIQMINMGLCQVAFDAHEALRTTPIGHAVLRGDETIQLAKPNQSHRSLRSKNGLPPTSAAVSHLAGDRQRIMKLYEHLKSWRLQLSRDRNIPAYVIFSDKTLLAMARSQPKSLDELKHIEGIGDKKLQDYGAAILDQIQGYDHAAEVFELGSTSKKKPTHLETRELYQSGMDYQQIALQRGIGSSTIINHLIKLHEEGKQVDFSTIVDDQTLSKIRDARTELEGIEGLKPYYKYFGGAVSYDQIRVGLVL